MAEKKAAAPKKRAAPKSKAPAPAPAPSPSQDNIDRLDDVRLTMTIELGRTRDTFGKLQEYSEQSLVELDKTVGEPVDVLLNGELFARGEVVTVSENFGVRIVELIKKPGD